jgi:hypothetical protein
VVAVVEDHTQLVHKVLLVELVAELLVELDKVAKVLMRPQIPEVVAVAVVLKMVLLEDPEEPVVLGLS